MERHTVRTQRTKGAQEVYHNKLVVKHRQGKGYKTISKSNQRATSNMYGERGDGVVFSVKVTKNQDHAV